MGKPTEFKRYAAALVAAVMLAACGSSTDTPEGSAKNYMLSYTKGDAESVCHLVVLDGGRATTDEELSQCIEYITRAMADEDDDITTENIEKATFKVDPDGATKADVKATWGNGGYWNVDMIQIEGKWFVDVS